MTNLFLRFYMSVIVILVVALAIMLFAFHYRLDTDFSIVMERTLGGGVQDVRQQFEAASGDDSTAILNDLAKEYPYPIRVVPSDQISESVHEGLSRGNDVLIHAGNELTVLSPCGRESDVLRFGPVAVGDGDIESDMIFAVALVLVLVACAIAILLRPLARQFGVLEETAIAIADGNLGARVDVQRADSAKSLARAFNKMASRTEALVRTQRELLQAVSHELRTPLARISFAIDLIRTAKTPDERESRLDSLDTASHDLNELVGELLQYVRLETGLPQPSFESIELLTLVEGLIEKAKMTCDRIEFQIGSELERGKLSLTADRSGLNRVLSNLLENASRFARSRVSIHASQTLSGTTIDVDDDGPGIPESDRERVLEPFVRLTENDSGVGLGLALVKRIITNHNGTVSVLHSPLGGCRVRTFWPKKL